MITGDLLCFAELESGLACVGQLKKRGLRASERDRWERAKQWYPVTFSPARGVCSKISSLLWRRSWERHGMRRSNHSSYSLRELAGFESRIANALTGVIHSPALRARMGIEPVDNRNKQSCPDHSRYDVAWIHLTLKHVYSDTRVQIKPFLVVDLMQPRLNFYSINPGKSNIMISNNISDVQHHKWSWQIEEESFRCLTASYDYVSTCT